MGLIINHTVHTIPGIEIRSWQNDPLLRLSIDDYRRRPKTALKQIILHTTKGIPGGKIRTPQKILPGLGPDTKRDERLAQMWSMDNRRAGAHLAVDFDGSVACFADIQTDMTFHAGNVNAQSIGIEIYQGSHGELYEGQLEVVVRLADYLTKHFSIQRQLHMPYGRQALKRGLKHGFDMVGVFGHRDVSNRRGAGDPGDRIMEMLIEAGYESFNFAYNEDKDVWKQRQKDLGVLADGVPGEKTVIALRPMKKHGLWVNRPGD